MAEEGGDVPVVVGHLAGIDGFDIVMSLDVVRRFDFFFKLWGGRCLEGGGFGFFRDDAGGYAHLADRATAGDHGG